MRELYTPAKMGGREFHIADGSISFSRRELYVSVEPGQVVTDSFEIRCSQEGNVCGEVLSDNVVMECLTPSFRENGERIGYRVDAAGLSDGDEIRGSLIILSNRGEYRLPYHIYVSSPQILPFEENGGREKEGTLRDLSGIKNLTQFTELARMEWQEAVRLFYAERFTRLLKTPEDRLLYRGLSVRPGDPQNMEEFLLASGRKAPVTFSVDRPEIRMEILGQVDRTRAREQSAELIIRRTGWGLTRLEVTCEGRFLEAGTGTGERGDGLKGSPVRRGAVQMRLQEADFLGSEARVQIRIRTRFLHAGRNFGSLLLSGPYQQIRVPVEVLCHKRGRVNAGDTHGYGRQIMELTCDYEKLCTGRLEGVEFLRRAEVLIQRMEVHEPGAELPRLYRVHLLLMEQKVRQAVAELESTRRKLAGVGAGQVLPMSYAQYEGESDWIYCYRQYLNALARGDAAEITPRTVRAIRERHRKDPADWRIGLMMMELSGEYPAGSAARWSFLRRLYRAGSRSRILYLEAWEVLSHLPELAGRVEEAGRPRTEGDPFTLKVLRYGTSRGMLTPALAERILVMAERSRSFSPDLAWLLRTAWEQPSLSEYKDRILQTLCSMLIRGENTDSAWNGWYARGIAQGLRLSRLSDCYVRSLPEDYSGEIPEAVLKDLPSMGALSYRTRAILFRSLYNQREALPALWETGREEAAEFTRRELLAGHINEDLARLYSACLRDEEFRQLTWERFSDTERTRLVEASCTRQVRTTRIYMLKVILLYTSHAAQEERRLDNGTARLPVYGTHNRLFFEDAAGHRYAISVPYTLDAMMEEADDRSAAETELPLCLLCRSGVEEPEFSVTAANAGTCSRLLDLDERKGRQLAPAADRRLRTGLLRFYEEEGRTEEAAELLHRTDPVELTGAERADAVRILAATDPSAAMDWMLDFGDSGVDPGAVLAAACAAPQALYEEPAPRMLWRAVNDPRADADSPDRDAALSLLCGCLDGTSEELDRLRSLCGERSLETGDLTVRLLKQMLFTGETIPGQADLLDLLREEGLDRQDPRLFEAGVSAYCHRVFSEEKRTDPRIAACLLDRVRAGDKLPNICLLALLRDCAEEGGSHESENRPIVRQMLTELLQQDILFPFFRHFSGMNSRLDLYAGETVAEYCDRSGRSDARIRIHYALEQGGRRDVFATREMKRVYDSFYVSAFLLFYGEQIHYFITDDEAGRNIVESGTLERDLRIRADRQERFGRIDALSRAAARGERREALAEIEDYERTDILVRRIFHEES